MPLRSARPRRSVLYVPANHGKALARLEALAADAVIIDLEDAVAPDDKAAARAALAALARPRGELVIRVNGPFTPWFGDDMAAAIGARPDAILVPKVDHPGDLRNAVDVLAEADEAGTTRLWAMIETPKALMNLREIAEFCANPGNRADCFVIGSNDLAKELGMPAPAPEMLQPLLLQVLVAARAAGLAVLDGVYNAYSDGEGFAAACRHAAAQGFDGKTLIHPVQIAPANAAFTPSDADIADAEAVVAAFDLPENRERGVLSLNGRMVERLHLHQARRLLARAGRD